MIHIYACMYLQYVRMLNILHFISCNIMGDGLYVYISMYILEKSYHVPTQQD